MKELALTWSEIMAGQSPDSIDWLLMVMFTIAGATAWPAIVMRGIGRWGIRSLMAVGWSMWSVKMWWAFFVGNDPVIPPWPAVAIMFITAAAILRNVNDCSCNDRSIESSTRR